MFFLKTLKPEVCVLSQKVTLDDSVLSNSYSQELSYSSVTLNSASIEKWSALLQWVKDISSRVT